MIKITFVRHGRSEADDLEVHEGRFDSELTEIGRQQAKARAKEWKDKGRHYDLILSSSLKRAKACADIFSSTLGTTIEIREGLMERDNGPLAGLTFSETAKLYPKAEFVNPYQPYVVSANTGESSIELYGRAALELQHIIRKGNGQYLVVSHGGFLNTLFTIICGQPPQNSQTSLIFAFGDLTYIDTLYHPTSDQWVIQGMRS